MRAKFTFLVAFFLCAASTIIAQSTAQRVYDIFQEKCVSCHSNANPQSGLDLEGAGATAAAKLTDVINNIKNVTPANSFAADRGYKYIYPGRADKSYLFRKINQGLEETIAMDAAEGSVMPNYQEQLTDTEQELIRQWILYGAPNGGAVVGR